MKKNNQLSKSDWVNMALDVLFSKGIDAVRVEVLARKIGVTKGSFYWHFKNLKALKTAMIQEWKNTQMGFLKRLKANQTGRTKDDLKALLEFTVSKDSRHDIGIRAWSLYDKAVEKAVREVDLARLSYIESLFREMGFREDDVEHRARLLYFYQVGDYITGKLDSQRKRIRHAQFRYQILTAPGSEKSVKN